MNEIAVETRQCIGTCQRTLPLTREYFHKKPTADPPFHTVCKECRNKAQLIKQEVQKTKLTKREAAVVKAVGLALGGGSTIPHVRELMEALYEAGGGVRNVANLMWVECLNAKPGSLVRMRFFDNVVRVTAKTTEMGGVKKPHDVMTDDELEIEAQRIEKQRMDNRQLRIVDGRTEDQKSA